MIGRDAVLLVCKDNLKAVYSVNYSERLILDCHKMQLMLNSHYYMPYYFLLTLFFATSTKH